MYLYFSWTRNASSSPQTILKFLQNVEKNLGESLFGLYWIWLEIGHWKDFYRYYMSILQRFTEIFLILNVDNIKNIRIRAEKN